MEGLLGVTASDTNVGGLTVRMLEPLTEPREAEIAVVPCAKLLARPWLPVELLIAATAGLEEFHVVRHIDGFQGLPDEHESVDDLADGPGLLPAIGDAGVGLPRGVHLQEVIVLGEDDPPSG